MNVLVVGFFDRGNFGDDLFAYLYDHLFAQDEEFNMKIASIETLDPLMVKEFDVLVLAGGDILNKYFLNKLTNILERADFQGTLHAFSAGIPLESVTEFMQLHMFSTIGLRSQRDFDALTLAKKDGLLPQSMDLYYLPDISIYLPSVAGRGKRVIPATIPDLARKWTAVPKPPMTKVMITLAQPFVANGNCSEMVDQIAKLVFDLITHADRQFLVYLIPFNTYISSKTECDIYFQRQIVDKVVALVETHGLDTSIVKKTVYSHEKLLSVPAMVNLFRAMEVGVHMRYHAHMLSIAYGLPFVSLGKTPKTRNLLNDMDYFETIHPQLIDGTSTDIDGEAVLHEIVELTMSDTKQKIAKSTFMSYVNGHDVEQFKLMVKKAIKCPKHVITTQRCPLRIVASRLVDMLMEKAKKPMTKYTRAQWIERLLSSTGALGGIADSYQVVHGNSREELAGFVTSIICYYLLDTPFPDYHYGMTQKVLTPSFNLPSELQWVWNNNHLPSKTKLTIESSHSPLFNASVVGLTDFAGCHRSGWQYVLRHILPMHGESAPVIFDNYLDRTFHWSHDIYQHVGIIPFRTPWVGVVHHTDNEEYTEYSLGNMVRKKTFQESLDQCRALIVLSQYLADQLMRHIGSRVPIIVLHHPTDLNVEKFDMEGFLAQPSPMVVQVGGWYRDSFAIYDLSPVPPSKYDVMRRIHVKPAALKGKNMGNNFPTPEMTVMVDDIKLMVDSTNTLSDNTLSDLACGLTPRNNKFASGMIRSLRHKLDNVQVISTLSNDEYDVLLANNIVFLRLLDASAVNTVIECIARNTPILVNRLPALEEYLGQDYPFFYETISEANNMVSDVVLIQRAHDHLAKIDKDVLQVSTFVRNLKTSLLQIVY